MFSCKASAKQPADVPFDQVFEQTMRDKFFELLPGFLEQAQRTAR
jgi:hypothetical protein